MRIPAARPASHRRRWPIAAALVLLALAATAVAALSTRGGGDGDHPVVGAVRIQADSATLSAKVNSPNGTGPFPLVVMPAAWGGAASQYDAAARDLVDRGYVVVAYAQRGWGGSTGKADLAGGASQADVSTVITWALRHTHADASRIALMGLSYGGGVSLLAAEHDPRVDAVVSMSAWGDAFAALMPGGADPKAAAEVLFGDALKKGRLDEAVRPFAEQLLAGDVAAARTTLRSLAPSRSAVTDVAALNERRVPVLLAGSYQDSVLPSGQLFELFARLTGPKRLQLGVGDHGAPERPGLLGHPDRFWTGMLAWLDHYLRGVNNGADRLDPVVLRDATTGAWHGYHDLDAMGVPLTAHLGATSLDLGPQPPWTRPLPIGTDSGANTAALQLRQGTYRPERIRLGELDASGGASWAGPPLTAATTIVGRPTLTLGVTSASAGEVSIFAYLYDLAADGSATLMSAGPAAVDIRGSGPRQPLKITLDPIAWTVDAGHRLVLVLDTVDPHYASEGHAGSVTLSGTTGAGAALLELRQG